MKRVVSTGEVLRSDCRLPVLSLRYMTAGMDSLLDPDSSDNLGDGMGDRGGPRP